LVTRTLFMCPEGYCTAEVTLLMTNNQLTGPHCSSASRKTTWRTPADLHGLANSQLTGSRLSSSALSCATV